MKYEIHATGRFKRDVNLAKKQGKNIDKLFDVIDILASGEELDARFRDHSLTGQYKRYRECHIEPDWLLIYEINDDILLLILQRVGSHSDLFK